MRLITDGSGVYAAVQYSGLEESPREIVEMAIAAGQAGGVDTHVTVDGVAIGKGDWLARLAEEGIPKGPAIRISAAEFAANWRELG